MKLQETRFKCEKCDTEFDSHIVVDCSVKTFTTALKEEVRCPNQCRDYKKIVLVRTDEIVEPT